MLVSIAAGVPVCTDVIPLQQAGITLGALASKLSENGAVNGAHSVVKLTGPIQVLLALP